MSYRVMMGTEALKVLRFLLLRGQRLFDLARLFIVRNELRTDLVANLLASLLITQLSRPVCL